MLGESVLAATIGVQTAARPATVPFGSICDDVVVGGLLIVFSMWWMYFDLPAEQIVDDVRRRFDDAAVRRVRLGLRPLRRVRAAPPRSAPGSPSRSTSAGGDAHLGSLAAGFAVTVPVAGYLLAVWVLHVPYKRHGALRAVLPPAGAALILASSATGEPVLATGLILAVLVAAGIASGKPAAEAH